MQLPLTEDHHCKRVHPQCIATSVSDCCQSDELHRTPRNRLHSQNVDFHSSINLFLTPLAAQGQIPTSQWENLRDHPPVDCSILQSSICSSCSRVSWLCCCLLQCTVTCGRGLRYRVVLCIDHRGQHVGGCNPQLKLHIKEECIVPVPCYKPKGNWNFVCLGLLLFYIFCSEN